MKRIFLATALAFSCFIGTAAAGVTPTSATVSKRADSDCAKARKAGRTCELVFDGDTVDGDRAAGDGDILVEKLDENGVQATAKAVPIALRLTPRPAAIRGRKGKTSRKATFDNHYKTAIAKLELQLIQAKSSACWPMKPAISRAVICHASRKV